MFPVDPASLSPQFGDIPVSGETRAIWDENRMRREKALRYYSGNVFLERVDVGHADDEAPLLYPVGLNLVKMLVTSMTDATYGEWKDQIVMFEGRRSSLAESNVEAASALMAAVLEASNASSSFWELDFSRNLYGAGVLRISRDLPTWPYVKWSIFPVDGFYPVFDPTDPDRLLECFAVSLLTAEQVRGVYNIDPATLQTIPLPGGIPGSYYLKTEHWTTARYNTFLNGMSIPAFSGVNPWGVVPFVYVPRVRTIDWFGESMLEDIYAPQDELNMRVADVGEALNYNMHPIRWGVNLPANFDEKNFPLGPNAMWNLGREFGNSGTKPEVGLLQADNPVPEAAFSYINFIYDWSRTSVNAPPIAFGEDNGGGQRSGVTLEIRLWPLLKAVRRSRSYLATGFRRALFITGKILEQKRFADVDASIPKALLAGEIVPAFHAILPRDQAGAVDEVVKLLSTDPPSISLETAQTVLGRGLGEIDRILETVALKQKIAAALAKLAAENAPKNEAGNPSQPHAA
jgi:hypothetical protein